MGKVEAGSCDGVGKSRVVSATPLEVVSHVTRGNVIASFSAS